MKKALLPVSILLVVTACGDDLISPNRERRSEALAARAVAGGLTTWPVSANRIDMSWTDNARNETGWEVHRSTTGATGAFTLLVSQPVNSTYHTDEALSPATEYCYKVRSFRQQGPKNSYAAFTGVSCATTYAIPAAPSNLSVRPVSSDAVLVVWTDNATDEQAIRFERAGDAAGPWQTVYTLAANTQSQYDWNRPAEQGVCYRVIAVGTYGSSSPSNVDCTAPPARPTSLTGTATGSIMRLQWTDASNVEDGYELFRNSATDPYTFTRIANLPANTSTFDDGTVAPDKTYTYFLLATKDGGSSTESERISVVTAPVAPPDAPGMTADAAGSTVAAVYWVSLSPSVTGFRIERSTDGQASWSTVATPAAGEQYFYDYDRVTEAEVCYRIYASNGLGASPASGVDCTRPPAAPTNVAVTYQEDGSVLVSWNDNSNVNDGYLVWTTYCYWYYEDYYCDYYRPLYAGANETSLAFYPDWDEYVSVVYATYENGVSDPGTWGGSEGAALRAAGSTASGRRVIAPKKGARAPVPLAVKSKQLRPMAKPGSRLP